MTPMIPMSRMPTSMVVRPPQAMLRRPNRSTVATTARMVTSWMALVMQVTAKGSLNPAAEKKYDE
jgi:hypothetical protein